VKEGHAHPWEREMGGRTDNFAATPTFTRKRELVSMDIYSVTIALISPGRAVGGRHTAYQASKAQPRNSEASTFIGGVPRASLGLLAPDVARFPWLSACRNFYRMLPIIDWYLAQIDGLNSEGSINKLQLVFLLTRFEYGCLTYSSFLRVNSPPPFSH
jgi:hypothetical protein